MTKKLVALGLATAVVAAGGAVAGCGGSGSSTTTPTQTQTPSTQTTMSSPPETTTTTPSTTTSAATGATTVRVLMAKGGEFKIVPSVASAPAGTVKFVVTNAGKMTHEMVVVPDPAGGPKALRKKDGSANEARSLGETSDVPAGTSKAFAIEMKAGKYVLLCNLPGHFAGGMYTVFTVR